MIEVLNCYERITNNHLESMYLQFMSMYDDSEIIMKAIYKSFEKMFIVNYEYINYLTFKHRILEDINYQLRNHIAIINENKSYIIDERIYLFNFNLYKYFNEVDNKIMMYLLINGYDINKVAFLLKQNENYIADRFYSIINWMKIYFNNIIKPYFVNK